ncbi:MAG TPA: hypothetical protein VK524_03020 [Polyangiaceae bacterium]|nr:hypothetical protein [Polyangiaceae bacterium]
MSCSLGENGNAPIFLSEAGADVQVTPICTPETGTDLPDPDFRDSNCDGIDGDSSHAVFVATTGADTASGELYTPVKTLARALSLARADAGLAVRDIYVCDGTYPESIEIGAAGVHIYGGFDCAKGWARSHRHALVSPPRGQPLRVSRARDVLIRHVDFKAPDAFQAGESVVAVSVLGSQDVTLEDAVLQAGNGAAGKPGQPSDPGMTTPPLEAAAGDSAPANLGCAIVGGYSETCKAQLAGGFSAKRTYACANSPGEYLGGWGGPGANAGPVDPDASSLGAAGSPPATSPRRSSGPAGGLPPAGRSGKAGTLGAPGASAQADFGSVVNGSYAATNAGGDGTPGLLGEAGDGGQGGWSLLGSDTRWYLGGGGGQGGFPGCGGAAGKGGGGGGASIALIAVDSSVTLSGLTIITGSGGAGGTPSAGAAGQPGGEAGRGGTGMPAPDFNTNGAQGGRGGDGGAGGPGGAGGGGPSIGIVIVGERPELARSAYRIGRGGAGAAGPSGNPAGSNGREATEYVIQ